MRVGFKTGPKNWEEGQEIVRTLGAKLCEVWFRIDKADDYEPMLTWLKQQKVTPGLHHWGLIDGRYKPNIASINKNIRQKTIQQIKDTIDVTARIEGAYVNAHCGAQATEILSFNPTSQQLADHDKADTEEAQRLCMESAQELQSHANKRGVCLTIETLPALELISGETRDFYEAGNIHYEEVAKIGQAGGYIANDITHTGAQMFMINPDPVAVANQLHDFTLRSAPYTRLLHVNTIKPPFGGMDTHDGVLPEDFAAGVWPSRQQVMDLLRIFTGRDDVFVIPEPHSHMKENYIELEAMVRELEG